MGETIIGTPAISLARELWRYGEPELAERAFALRPAEMARIGKRAGALLNSAEADRLWPDGPRYKALLLAGVEHLEGKPRPCPRTRRLPECNLPPHLQATEDERWAAMAAQDEELRREEAAAPASGASLLTSAKRAYSWRSSPVARLVTVCCGSSLRI